MPQPELLLGFSAAALLVVVIPGSSVIYVVTRSAEHGTIIGLVSVLGLETGAALHVGLSALGAATVIHAVPMGLEIIAWVGAGYLIWLAVDGIVSARKGAEETVTEIGPNRGRVFFDGLLVDLFNPKTLLFFLAFLPQFVDRGMGSSAVQIVILGAIFVILATVCDGTYAILAGRLSRRLRQSTLLRRRLSFVTAAVYLLLALMVLLI